MEDTENEEALEITELPSGRSLKPIGSVYRIAAKGLSEMSDWELKTHIVRLKNDVKEAEMLVDQKRTHLYLATNESEIREEKQRRHLRNIKWSPSGVKVAIKPEASASDVIAALVGKWKLAGKSNEEIMDSLAKIQMALETKRKQA